MLSSAVCLLASGSAYAATDLSLSIGTPGYVEAPVVETYPPAVYSPGYVDYVNRYPSQSYAGRGHRRHDWSYWSKEHAGHAPAARAEHAERRR